MKSKLKEQIDLLPEEFTMDELFERLIFINKVKSGLRDSNYGKKISEDELQNLIQKWVA